MLDLKAVLQTGSGKTTKQLGGFMRGSIRIAVALCAVAALGLVGISEASAKQQARSTLDTHAQRAIQDCTNDGDLDRRYSTKVLLRAEQVLPADVDEYTNCRSVIERQLLKQNRAAARVITDCTADGDLDRRYGKGTLRKALLILPSDVDEYTNCRSVITSALNARSRR